MIVSHILGGIGNQMFQYAAGRSLAANLSQDFFLDLSSFKDYELHHGFQLDRVFNISSEVTEVKSLNFFGWRYSRLMMKFMKRPWFAFLRGGHFLIEPHFNYRPDFFNPRSKAYLYGYWQSEKYFKFNESFIRQEFSFKKPLCDKNLKIAQHIASVNSISLHVRRGDYVTDQKTARIMSLCDPTYYQRAIRHVANHVEKPVFFVFSDDVEWAKKNIAIDYPCTYIDHNRQEHSYIDMQLMSLCKHHIIANSSFSWWGAWLNSSLEKIVVAPAVWFIDGTDDCDLVPEAWIRL